MKSIHAYFAAFASGLLHLRRLRMRRGWLPTETPPLLACPRVLEIRSFIMPSFERDLGLKQSSAITEIWSRHGKASCTLPVGTLIWSAGSYLSPDHISDEIALWATADAKDKQGYDDSAIQRAKGCSYRKPAFRFELSIPRALKMADFKRHSMQSFCTEFKSSHDEMKLALRTWCLANDFDGIVRVNRGTYEVVICQPKTSLALDSYIQLWP
jgi:hypothetical protein